MKLPGLFAGYTPIYISSSIEYLPGTGLGYYIILDIILVWDIILIKF